MAEKTIMLVCAAGLSTSMLVTKMEKAAAARDIEVTIFAAPNADAQFKLKEMKPDVLMLGPQVRFMLSKYQEKLEIPVEVINMRDYGTMNGDHVLSEALRLIDEGK